MDEVKSTKPIVLNANDIIGTASERFSDTNTGGDVSWRTLISTPKTPTNTFTVGIATCAPGVSAGCQGYLKPHRHKQAEIYHFTLGKGLVTIDGEEYEVGKGSVVWIPGDAEHGVRNSGEEDLVWLYAFATDGFEDVVYRFDDPERGQGKRAGNTRAKL
ncbi:RmlC-like cupin [Periconia macrospinosa]|uniref:RmlC-like cupin n=1 Tax=Periconia macrospinosa TaxID=97972 RepID=A0A2V1DI95_9PLEO|nr:RmlC-like cupin [Periconia macrospinosa]